MPQIANPRLQALIDFERKLLNQWAAENHPNQQLSDEAIALELDFDRSTLSKMLNGNKSRNSVLNLKTLAEALDISDEEWTRLILLHGEWKFERGTKVEPKVESPEAIAERLKGDSAWLADMIRKRSKDSSVQAMIHTAKALYFNPALHRQVKTLIRFADKLRPLDGIRRRKKMTEADREMKKLKKAKKALNSTPKETQAMAIEVDLQ